MEQRRIDWFAFAFEKIFFFPSKRKGSIGRYFDSVIINENGRRNPMEPVVVDYSIDPSFTERLIIKKVLLNSFPL